MSLPTLMKRIRDMYSAARSRIRDWLLRLLRLNLLVEWSARDQQILRELATAYETRNRAEYARLVKALNQNWQDYKETTANEQG